MFFQSFSKNVLCANLLPRCPGVPTPPAGSPAAPRTLRKGGCGLVPGSREPLTSPIQPQVLVTLRQHSQGSGDPCCPGLQAWSRPPLPVLWKVPSAAPEARGRWTDSCGSEDTGKVCPGSRAQCSCPPSPPIWLDPGLKGRAQRPQEVAQTGSTHELRDRRDPLMTEAPAAFGPGSHGKPCPEIHGPWVKSGASATSGHADQSDSCPWCGERGRIFPACPDPCPRLPHTHGLASSSLFPRQQQQ